MPERPYTQFASESVTFPAMADVSEVAKKLKALRNEGGISIREAAKAAGLTGGGYQHYEDRFKDDLLPVPLINKLVPLFERQGVDPSRLRALAGIETPQTLISNVSDIVEAPDVTQWPKDLPVYGSAGASPEEHAEFEYNRGEIVDRIRRPPRLQGVQKAFAIYLVGESMIPRYDPGSPILIHPGQQPRAGDDVLVELKPAVEGGAHPALVKRLVSRNDTKLRLAQFNPPRDDIVVPMKRVLHIYKVVSYDDLFSY